MDRSIPGFGRDLSSIISFGHRRSSFLGPASLGAHVPVCFERHQCGCGRLIARCAVQSGLDKRDLLTRRLWPWYHCIWSFDVLEVSSLDGGCVVRRWRRSANAHLISAVKLTAPDPQKHLSPFLMKDFFGATLSLHYYDLLPFRSDFLSLNVIICVFSGICYGRNMAQPIPQLMNTREVARYLGINEKKVYALA